MRHDDSVVSVRQHEVVEKKGLRRLGFHNLGLRKSIDMWYGKTVDDSL